MTAHMNAADIDRMLDAARYSGDTALVDHLELLLGIDAATVADEYDDDPPCCPAGSENKWDARTWCGCQINR